MIFSWDIATFFHKDLEKADEERNSELKKSGE